MPRKYVKKVMKASYSKEDLEKAIDDVNKNKCNPFQASKRYNIPRTTIIKHTKGWKNCPPTMRFGAGRPTELAFEDERTLALCIKKMNNWGFGLSRKELMLVVRDYITANKIPSRFKDGQPGEDWYLGFMLRHNLSLKKPENKQDVRYLQADPEIVYGFHDILAGAIKELGLENKPDQIYNSDETGMNYDPSTTKVVGGKGEICSRRTIGTGRTNTTVLATVSASGRIFPPFILYKAVNLWDKWMPEAAYPNTMYDVSENGFMTEKNYLTFFKNQFLPNAPERPCILIYDGHLSHVSVNLIKLAMEENVTLLKLPPHTTDFLQPLDVAGFKPLKTEWDKMLVQWQRKHYGQSFGKPEFAKLLGKTWPALKSEHVVSGFRKTGLFPVNPGAIDTKIFDQQKLKDFLITRAFHPCPKSLPDITILLPNPDASLQDGSSVLLSLSHSASTSSQPSTSISLLRLAENESPDDFPCCSRISNTNPEAVLQLPTPRKRAHTFEEILLSKIEKPTINVKGKKTKVPGGILTREELLKDLEGKTSKRKKKEHRPTLKSKARKDIEPPPQVVRILFNKSSDEELNFSDVDKDESFDPPDEEPPTIPQNSRQFNLYFQKLQAHIEEEKYYAVYYEENYFYGKATKVFTLDSEKNSPVSQVEIQFLQKKIGETGSYWWPLKPKVELVAAKQIFYGPVEPKNANPFIFECDEIVFKFYRAVRANRDKIYAI